MFWSSFVKCSGLIGDVYFYCMSKVIGFWIPFIFGWCVWNKRYTLSDGKKYTWYEVYNCFSYGA